MTTANVPTRETTQTRATLSRDLSEFLIELSIGVHRYSMYPDNHPSLRPAVENLVLRMSRLFESRKTIDIGVAQKQLVIEGVATDPRHPVLSDLARRLHDHQLGAISLVSGVGTRELQELLALLAQDVDHDGEPAGQMTEEQLARWSHVRLHPLGYDRLQLAGQSSDTDAAMDPATRLWLGLAQSALQGRDVPPEKSSDAGEIARTISEHQREEAYDQVIVGYMLQLAAELKTSSGEEAVRVRGQVASLIREMDGETLEKLVGMGGDLPARQKFVLDANESLAVDAVVKVLQSAAAASHQTVSNSMTRLLGKLSTHAERGTGAVRARAGSALRENVEELIAGWELDDPNPDQYTRVLDAMAHASPIFDQVATDANSDAADPAGREIPGPVRIMQMALEVDAFGPTVEAAVMDMIDRGMAGELFRMIQGAPSAMLSTRVLAYLTNPERVREILSRDGLDDRGLDELIAQMGSRVIDPIFDVLLASDSRSVRRRLFDRLVGLGESVTGSARARLETEDRWFGIRNLIALLARVPNGATGLDLKRYLEYDDARVRREALPLALRGDRGVRERALAYALADPDDRVVRTALVEMREGVPDAVVPSLVKRVVNSDRDEDLRVLGVRVLRSSSAVLAREALIDICVEGTSLFGRVKIADTSPVLAAAVATLAAGWSDHEDVKPIIDQARRSRDPGIRRAVGAT